MRFQRILSLLLIAFAVGLLFLAAFIASSALRVQDLAQYWAGAHLIRQNPYSETLVTDFERSFGYSMNSPAMVMRNPPSALAAGPPTALHELQLCVRFLDAPERSYRCGLRSRFVVSQRQFRIFAGACVFMPSVRTDCGSVVGWSDSRSGPSWRDLVPDHGGTEARLAGRRIPVTDVRKASRRSTPSHCNCPLDYSDKTMGRIPFAGAFARRHERRRIALEPAYFCPVHRIRSRVRWRNHAVPQYRRVTLRHIRIPRFGILAADRRARVAWLLLAKASFQLGLEVTRDGGSACLWWLAAITAFPLIKSSCCLP